MITQPDKVVIIYGLSKRITLHHALIQQTITVNAEEDTMLEILPSHPADKGRDTYLGRMDKPSSPTPPLPASIHIVPNPLSLYVFTQVDNTFNMH
jgi:hypothetical protein